MDIQGASSNMHYPDTRVSFWRCKDDIIQGRVIYRHYHKERCNLAITINLIR